MSSTRAWRGVPAAVGRAEVLRIVVPGTAADDTPTCIAIFHPRRSVRWRTFVAVVPGVLDPFPYVAVHVVKAEGIGRFLADRLRPVVGVRAIPGIADRAALIVPTNENRVWCRPAPRTPIPPRSAADRSCRSSRRTTPRTAGHRPS